MCEEISLKNAERAKSHRGNESYWEGHRHEKSYKTVCWVGASLPPGKVMKKYFKRLLLFLSFIPASPFIMVTYLGSIAHSENLFETCSVILSLIPGKIGSFIRVAYYLGTLEKMSFDVYIDFGSFFVHRTARVGGNVTIGAYCILGTVTIGDDVLVGSRVSIPSGKYQHGSLRVSAEEIEGINYDRVIIGERSWIGEGAIVMANVGKNAIIASGSVVTRSIPENMVAMGNPARPVIKRKQNTI